MTTANDHILLIEELRQIEEGTPGLTASELSQLYDSSPLLAERLVQMRDECLRLRAGVSKASESLDGYWEASSVDEQCFTHDAASHVGAAVDLLDGLL